LLSNAIDALEETDNREQTTGAASQSPPAITIHTEVSSTNHILIRIVDNGPGIPENTQQRLFDPFFTTKPVGKGTGLGLSISYQIVTEKHGGSLKCVSQLGQGAEFKVEIPVRSRLK
jgi:signal transduction histidine kinase